MAEILLTLAFTGKPAPVISTGAAVGTPVGLSNLKTFPLFVPTNRLDVAALYAPLDSPIAFIVFPAPTAVAIPDIVVQPFVSTVEAVVVRYNVLSFA